MSSVKIPIPGPVIKPSKVQVRPNSASGNIQTHPSYNSGLFDKKCFFKKDKIKENVTETNKLKKSGTHIGFTKESLKIIEPKDEIKKPRRRTVEIVDGIDITKFIGREMSLSLQRHKLLEKIEERIDLTVFEELKVAFENALYDRSGKLDLSEFKSLLKEKLQLPSYEDIETELLFKKIDWASAGVINWNEFCTYMQLEYAEKEETYLKAREMAFTLPARVENTPHRENVIRITSTVDGNFIAGSTDGILSFWSNTLELKKCKSVVTVEQSQRVKSKWIIDFLIMNEFNKIVVATGDREIEFFELSSFEPYCRIHSLETVPLCLEYYIDKDNIDDCILLWGDRQGCVNILHMQATGECLRTWKKQPRSEGIAGIGMETVLSNPTIKFHRWKVHNDWVLKLKYYDSLRQVISCSNDEATALVIGCLEGSTQIDQQMKPKSSSHKKSKENSFASIVQARKRIAADQTVFNIYKGIQTFDFGKSKNVLVTGGLDRIIRLWNPYVNSKPTGMLRGHNKPLVYIHIAEPENRIFSICADKCVKVWDLHDHNCLLTVRPKAHRIRGDMQSCHYSHFAKALMIATDQVSILNIKINPFVAEKQLEERHKKASYVGGCYFDQIVQNTVLMHKPPVLYTDVAISHKDSVTCCKYNEAFNQVLTCCEGSTVKLWDLDTGEKAFEFNEAHGENGITCLTFDPTNRRLLTGGRDGIVKMWNFNNGHCLTELKRDEADFNGSEISCVEFVEISRNKFIISVGWDRGINVYIDQCESVLHRSYAPQPRWLDDLSNGHREDILTLATLKGNLLATADYHGTIIVWNLMSGHIFFKLSSVATNIDEDSDYIDEDLSINKLLFLQSRAKNKSSASLVASGPYGLVHFWNVKEGGILFARFKAGTESGQSLTTMMSCPDYQNDSKVEDKFLFVGDRFGFVSMWDIETYAATKIEENCPELVRRWRAHTGSVTGMDLVVRSQVVITSSDDCTVRVWTFEGEYVGTFGQTEPWNLSDPKTFQHPMVPYDVLVHPQSLPDHPVLGPRMSKEQRKEQNKDMFAEKVKSARQNQLQSENSILSHKSVYMIDDDLINQQIDQKVYKDGKGKRLRYERLKPRANAVEDGGPNEYRSLQVFELAETPSPRQPEILNNRKDIFQFFD